MRRNKLQIVCLVLLLALLPVSAFSVKLEEVTKQVAKQNNAKVLAAKTVKRGNKQTHEIKLLTQKGVVKTVKVPDNNGKKKR